MKNRSLMVLSLSIVMAGAAYGQNPYLSLMLDDNPVAFGDTSPILIEGVPMVPIRAVVEASGAQVEWDGFAKTVRTSGGTSEIELTIGSRSIWIDGQSRDLSVAPMLYGDRTLVPLALLESALGAAAYYDPQQSRITLLTATTPVFDSTSRDQSMDEPSSSSLDEPEQSGPSISESASITSVHVDTGTWTGPGDEVHISAAGTPGLIGTARIAEYGEEIALIEESPGHYVGSWRVPEASDVDAISLTVTCTLRDGSGDHIAVMDSTEVLLADRSMPTITAIYPGQDAWLTRDMVTVSADLHDVGSGIDAASIQLIVNGEDKSDEAFFEEGKLVWNPKPEDLREKIDIHLSVRDLVSNEVKHHWTFRVDGLDAERSPSGDDWSWTPSDSSYRENR